MELFLAQRRALQMASTINTVRAVSGTIAARHLMMGGEFSLRSATTLRELVQPSR